MGTNRTHGAYNTWRRVTMATTGSGRFRTRKNRPAPWLVAVLALSLLAVSCSGPGDDDAADMAAPDLIDSARRIRRR